MHDIPAGTEAQLRRQGLTDADIDVLRTTGTFRRDGESPLTVTAQGGYVSIVQGLTSMPADLQAMQAQAVGQAETMLGIDLDGDGKVGSGGTPGSVPPRVAMTTSHVQSQHTAGSVAGNASSAAMPTSDAAHASGPFVGGAPDDAAARTRRLIMWFIALDAVIGVAIVSYFLMK